MERPRRIWTGNIHSKMELRKEHTKMTKENAINFLKAQGWDDIGAEEIVIVLEEDEMLAEMTEEELAMVSEDYMDR